FPGDRFQFPDAPPRGYAVASWSSLNRVAIDSDPDRLSPATVGGRLDLVARTAQRLQIVGVVRPAFRQRDDVIHLGGVRDPALCPARNTQVGVVLQHLFRSEEHTSELQ